MDHGTILEAARAISRLLSDALDEDFQAKTIELGREEAVVALGLIDGVIDLMEKEADGRKEAL